MYILINDALSTVKLILIIIMTQHHNIDPYYSFKCAIASFFANYVVGVFHPL